MTEHLELAYPKRKFDIILTDMERPLNDLLVKLLLMPEGEQAHKWRNEATEMIEDLEMLRLKPTRQPAEEIVYYQFLFDEPYGNDRKNVHAQIERLRRYHNFILRDVSDAVHTRLQVFHRRLSRALSKGETGLSERLLRAI